MSVACFCVGGPNCCITRNASARLTPHKCPVCNGAGRINKTTPNTPLSSAASVTYETGCHGCNGTGVVWG